MADAMEALRQDVGQEPADELGGRQHHCRVPFGTLDPVVLDLEGHVLGVGRDQAPVGEVLSLEGQCKFSSRDFVFARAPSRAADSS